MSILRNLYELPEKNNGICLKMAVIYALGCLCFSALNDFVFKLYARKDRSRGIFVFLCGVLWVLLLGLRPVDWENSLAPTLTWGIVSGLFSVISNLLLIEAMGFQSAGVCATIFRLNLVIVVIAAILWLGETVTFFQVLGILCAIGAILAFMPRGTKFRVDENSRAMLGIYLVLAACILRAGMGLTYKYGFLHGADPNGVPLLNGVCWIVGGLVYAVLREKKIRFSKKTVGYGMLSGALLCGIVFFMALMLNAGAASVTLSIAQMSFLGTFALSMIFLKEKLTSRTALAVVLGVCAILFLSAFPK